MSYESFCERVGALANRTGVEVEFSHEDGKHIAKCSDGVVITGNARALRVHVRWGSGHTALATV